MKALSHVVLALALVAGSAAFVIPVGPANAQVSIGVGEGGPRVYVGPNNNDRRYRGDRRRGYEGRAQGECREVTTRSRGRDGSTIVRTSRRCN
jgi:hypothetical protein